MTEDEKWAALRKTALSDHEPFCNYGQTNGREMCTCQVLVDLVEVNHERARTTTPAATAERVAAGDDLEPTGAGPQRGGRQSTSDARKVRLAQHRAAAAGRKRNASRA